jgi:TM2 domain-containing membrane protein YozV
MKYVIPLFLLIIIVLFLLRIKEMYMNTLPSAYISLAANSPYLYSY